MRYTFVPESSLYHTVNVFNEGRFVMALDYENRNDAVREAAEFQGDGITTEILTLSTADLFDTAPDNYNDNVDRTAY